MKKACRRCSQTSSKSAVMHLLLLVLWERDAAAGTDWKMKSTILTYSRSKGAFAGISLNGSVIKQDNDATKAFYGQDMTNQQLLAGQVPAPPDARNFLNTVAHTQTVASSR